MNTSASSVTSVFSLIKEKTELVQIINSMVNHDAKRFVQTRIDQIDQILAKMGEYSNLLTFLFENPKIEKIQKTETTIYDPKIALVYAPPQVGKTAAMIQIITDCIARGVSVVVSSDNKKDQMAQMFSRLVRAVESNPVFDRTFITTVDNKNFDSVVEKMNCNQFNSFVICCLDNKTQIGKVYEKINSVYENGKLSSLCLIHDEADTVTKARNISEVAVGQPESHKKWIELTTKICGKGVDLKRIFVTATPENVVYLHKPQFVWVLDIPETYVSADAIQFSELSIFDNQTITRILTREARLRREEGGIILYCVERNKETCDSEDDYDEASQSQVFYNAKSSIKKTGLDVVSIYNSDGIRVAFRTQRLGNLFINKLEDQGVRYNMNEENENDFLIKKNELSISRFYGMVQEVGAKVVLTIGRDLLSRGISFVSNATTGPLTATTMIYKPGSQLSQVAIAQAIGRLNGTAQPTLKRRLYTTDDVYTNYTTFNRNQKEIISAIKENDLSVDNDLIANIALWKASRTVDRKALQLERNMTFWEDPALCGEEDDGYFSDEGCIDGVKLSNLQKWINGDTLVAKMINYLYTCETPITFDQFQNEIEYSGGSKRFRDNIDNGRSLNSKYGKLWNCQENMIVLNQNIREYINNL